MRSLSLYLVLMQLYINIHSHTHTQTHVPDITATPIDMPTTLGNPHCNPINARQ